MVRWHGTEWALDLRWLDGVDLQPTSGSRYRPCSRARDMAHLRRLVAEQLARVPGPRPTTCVCAWSTVPLAAGSHSFLPEDNRPGR